MASKRRSNKKCSKRKIPVRSHRRPSIGKRVKAYCKRKSRKTRSYKPRKSRKSCPKGKSRVPSFRTRSGQVVKSFCAKKRGSSRRRRTSYKKKRSYTYSYKPSVPTVGPNCLVRSLETCSDDPNCQVRGGNMCVARRGVRQGVAYQGPMFRPQGSSAPVVQPTPIPQAPVVPNPVQIMGLSQPFKSTAPIYVNPNAPAAPMVGPMCTTRALNVCEQEPHCVKRGKQCVARSGVRKGYYSSALTPYTQKSFEEETTTQ
jgi:hypothetical protein